LSACCPSPSFCCITRQGCDVFALQGAFSKGSSMLFPSVVCQKQMVQLIAGKLAETKVVEPEPVSTQASEQVEVTQHKLSPHKLKKKVFLIPTWCANCAGILVGSGYQCTCCRARCHLGLGKGSENCKADMLLEPCKRCSPSVRLSTGEESGRSATSKTPKRYEFGDVSRQLVRNAHQTIKDTVVKEAIKEQQAFGKFDLLREQVLELQRRWTDGFFVRWFIGLQIALMVSIWAITFGTVQLLAGQNAGDPSVVRLANAQATCAIRSLLLLEMFLLVVVRIGAGRAFMHSDLIFTFIKEILHVDMAELADIRISEAAKSVQRTADGSLVFLSVLFVITLALGLQAMKNLVTLS